MTPLPPKSRQTLQAFERRIDVMLNRHYAGGRALIDNQKYILRAAAARGSEERLYQYGLRRAETVGRILLLTRQMLVLDAIGPGTRIDTRGALWQGFRGTEGFEACHTSPALLTFDGQLPTTPVRNVGLRRRLVLEFADCMLMSSEVNHWIDCTFDHNVGAHALAAAAVQVAHGKAPDEAGRLFCETMRTQFGVLLDLSPRELAMVSTQLLTPTRGEGATSSSNQLPAVSEGGTSADAAFLRAAVQILDEALAKGANSTALANFEQELTAEIAQTAPG